MILQVTPEELDHLIKQCVVQFSNNRYSISTKEINGKSIDLPVLIESQEFTPELKSNNQELSLEESLNLIKEKFPRDIEKVFNRTGGRNLRTGKNPICIKHIKTLHSLGFTTDKIVKALDYEINKRVKGSIKDNQLQYMKGMEAWLNDTVNIEAMYEESLENENVNDGFPPTQSIY